MSLDTPSIIPMPWASASTEEVYEVPTSTTKEGRASWSEGFPEITAEPLVSGGIPPNRLDFQGVLNTISQHLVFLQSGSVYPWNNSLDYLKGARVLGSDGEEYICQASHEAIDFQDPTTDSANAKWKKMQFVLGDKMYPVGSIYMTVENVSPADKFGGVWERISQGRFLVGVDGNKYLPKGTGGSATHAITENELPSHTHTVTAGSGGSHTHTASSSEVGAHKHTVTIGSGGAHSHTATLTTNGTHTHTRGSMDITGGGLWWESSKRDDAKNQAYGAFYVNTDVSNALGSNASDYDNRRVDFKASRSWSGSTSSNGGHNHTVTVGQREAHVHSATVSEANKHNHTVTISACSAHTHNMTVTATGGGAAMSIVPPYYACYMWRRTE